MAAYSANAVLSSLGIPLATRKAEQTGSAGGANALIEVRPPWRPNYN